MFEKIALTLPPASCTAPNATSAINATSNAYSSRSWPDSSFANSCSFLIRDIHIPPAGACRLGDAAQARGDVAEDGVHAAAGELHRTERDQRDQRDEQRVLEQVLARFVVREHPELIDQRHDISSCAHSARDACVRFAATPFLHDRVTSGENATGVPRLARRTRQPPANLRTRRKLRCAAQVATTNPARRDAGA